MDENIFDYVHYVPDSVLKVKYFIDEYSGTIKLSSPFHSRSVTHLLGCDKYTQLLCPFKIPYYGYKRKSSDELVTILNSPVLRYDDNALILGMHNPITGTYDINLTNIFILAVTIPNEFKHVIRQFITIIHDISAHNIRIYYKKPFQLQQSVLEIINNSTKKITLEEIFYNLIGYITDYISNDNYTNNHLIYQLLLYCTINFSDIIPATALVAMILAFGYKVENILDMIVCIKEYECKSDIKSTHLEFVLSGKENTNKLVQDIQKICTLKQWLHKFKTKYREMIYIVGYRIQLSPTELYEQSINVSVAARPLDASATEETVNMTKR